MYTYKIYKYNNSYHFLTFYSLSNLNSLSPPFQNLKSCGLHLVVSPRNQFCLLHPRLYLPSRIDATPRKNIISGIDTSHNQIRTLRGVPLTRSFLVAMESRSAFIFTAKYFDDSTARRTFSSGDKIVAIVLVRSLGERNDT